MFGSNNFSAIVFITALYLLQLWQHEVEAGEFICNGQLSIRLLKIVHWRQLQVAVDPSYPYAFFS